MLSFFKILIIGHALSSETSHDFSPCVPENGAKKYNIYESDEGRILEIKAQSTSLNQRVNLSKKGKITIWHGNDVQCYDFIKTR